jgi:hypothetical protein
LIRKFYRPLSYSKNSQLKIIKNKLVKCICPVLVFLSPGLNVAVQRGIPYAADVATVAPQRRYTAIKLLPGQVPIQLARPFKAMAKNRALHINDKGHHDAY